MGVATGPITTHEFWQFIAWVSQVTRQDVMVDVCGNNCGGGGGVGTTTFCARRSNPKAAEVPATVSTMLNCRIRRMERSIGRNYLI